jgi:hypothetical protein
MPLSPYKIQNFISRERNKTVEEIRVLEEKLEVLDYLIANFDSFNTSDNLEPKNVTLNPLKADRIPLTRIIVKILENNPNGLTLDDIVKFAQMQGVTIKSTSTATMLHRLKSRNVVDHFGRVYQVKRG